MLFKQTTVLKLPNVRCADATECRSAVCRKERTFTHAAVLASVTCQFFAQFNSI